MAERVFSIVTRPETGLEIFALVRDHVANLHAKGLQQQVGYDLLSNGRVILLRIRGANVDALPEDTLLETVLADVFLEELSFLAQELVDGFYTPSFAHCASEKVEE